MTTEQEKQTAATVVCPVEETLKLIGGKYKSLILWHLSEKTLRFGELQRIVTSASPRTLTMQLRELEEDGLVHREVYQVVPPKVEYSLTGLGQTLRPLLEVMYRWGSDYLKEQGLTANCSMHPAGDSGAAQTTQKPCCCCGK